MTVTQAIPRQADDVPRVSPTATGRPKRKRLRSSSGPRWVRFDAAHCDHRPKFRLFATSDDDRLAAGHWQFALCRPDGSLVLVASDEEPDFEGERLALLAVVRGLEALEQPSQVEVIASSSYVRRGISFGVSQWRRSDWKWESFGQMVPIKNADLWRRVDRAMRIHRVECRRWHLTTDTDVDVPKTDARHKAIATLAEQRDEDLLPAVRDPKHENQRWQRVAGGLRMLLAATAAGCLSSLVFVGLAARRSFDY